MHFCRLNDLPPAPVGKSGWPWTEESSAIPDFSLDGGAWPKISIVTPNFNQGQFIEETIRSVLLQNYPNTEYIVMDGGSSDDSVAIIKKYESWLACWVSESDSGQYDAINKGFGRSSGLIMMWINSDDMLVRNSLGVIATIFLSFKNQVQWLTGIPAYWDINNNLYQILSPMNYQRRLISLGCYHQKALGWIMQECTCWTRNLWDLSGGSLDSSLNYAADFELWCRFGRYADLYSISTILGANRQRYGQKTELAFEYYREIDQVVRRKILCLMANKLFLISPVRKLARLYFIAKKNKFSIYYESRKLSWKVNS